MKEELMKGDTNKEGKYLLVLKEPVLHIYKLHFSWFYPETFVGLFFFFFFAICLKKLQYYDYNVLLLAG
jgi:hypothetical protein